MPRAFILVADSLGIGAAPDALAFGDAGASTLGHIATWRAQQGRPLQIPNLEALGLGAALRNAAGTWHAHLPRRDGFEAAFAAAAERSRGKDTPSGHWEMTGCPVDFDWGYFPRTVPCFPAELMAQWHARCGLGGSLGQCHASGTEIIAQLGDEHVRSGWPIVYTSSDSVFQVAAHEQHFGLDRLLDICAQAFDLLQPLNIARVIARPFTGEAGAYRRTHHRKDFAIAPPAPTLLDVAQGQGRTVVALGKIGDIFAMRGVSSLIKGDGNAVLFDRLLEQAATAPDGALVFANFVDFDQNFGHRRDVAGYAQALEEFDARLPAFRQTLGSDDLCVITADHGCDPTWPGTDHTREFVPQLFFGPGVAPRDLGARSSFCDLGQTLARHLGLPTLAQGTALL